MSEDGRGPLSLDHHSCDSCPDQLSHFGGISCSAPSHSSSPYISPEWLCCKVRALRAPLSRGTPLVSGSSRPPRSSRPSSCLQSLRLRMRRRSALPVLRIRPRRRPRRQRSPPLARPRLSRQRLQQRPTATIASGRTLCSISSRRRSAMLTSSVSSFVASRRHGLGPTSRRPCSTPCSGA